MDQLLIRDLAAYLEKQRPVRGVNGGLGRRGLDGVVNSVLLSSHRMIRFLERSCRFPNQKKV